MERIATPKRTREIIEQNAFTFKKSFGQNFLIDANVLDNIIKAAAIEEHDFVLEIGPGIGSLTQALAETGANVMAVEIDSNLIPILEQTLRGYENISILNEDILKIDLEKLIQEKSNGRQAKVVANLPYYITTPIVMGILEKKAPVKTITVMVQKEVAARMQAKPGEADYGALSLAVQYYTDAVLDFVVKPTCFIPQPKVDSAVITLQVLPQPKIKVMNEKLLFHLIKCAFGQRRKTLLNSLFNQAGLGISKESLTGIVQSLGLDERIRGEMLSIEQFGKLSDEINRMAPDVL